MRKITIRTPEQVEIELKLAGVGSRFVGIAIDTLIQFVLLLIVWLSVFVTQPSLTSKNFLDFIRSGFAALLIVLTFLITFGYFIFFETIWSGQTPGKKFAKIKVLKDNGEPVSFIDVLIRNIFRIVDFLPFYYMIGIISILASNKAKRIGDIAAKTVVVLLKEESAHPLFLEVNVEGANFVDVSLLGEEEYNLARNFLIRRKNIKGEHRGRVAKKVAKVLYKKMGINNIDMGDEEFIEAIVSEYQKRRKFL